MVTREENFVEVEAHKESLVEENDSREKDEEKSEDRTQQQWEKCSQVEIQRESILQVNTSPYQLIGKEERHAERDKSLSVIFSFNTNFSLAMVWKAFPGYMSFMESLAKKRKCKEDVFYVTFMPPWRHLTRQVNDVKKALTGRQPRISLSFFNCIVRFSVIL